MRTTTTKTTTTAAILAVTVVIAAAALSLVATAQVAQAQSLEERLTEARETIRQAGTEIRGGGSAIVETLRGIANIIGGSGGGGGEIPGCGRACG